MELFGLILSHNLSAVLTAIFAIIYCIMNVKNLIFTSRTKRGLIIERAGRKNEVVKIMPPLVIEDELLLKGLNILKDVMVEITEFMKMMQWQLGKVLLLVH